MLTGPPTRPSPWPGLVALGMTLAALCFIAWLILG